MDTEAVAIAEKQAAEDAALLASLQERDKDKPKEPAPVRVPMNRAERRAQVKLYAMVLADTERQTPVRNATIIPRAARRQRKHGRRK